MTARPWYVSLLLGGAGWVAGIFVLLFVFLLFKPDSGGSGLAVGPVLLVAAWGLFMADREGAFVSQLALALSIAGQFAVLFGFGATVFKGSSEVMGLALTALVMQVALVAAMPSRLHRTMSTLFACAAWAVLVRYGLWDRAEWTRAGVASVRSSPVLALAGWALAWLPVGGALYALIRTEPAWMAAGREALARSVASGLIVGLVIATLLSEPFESFWWLGLAGGRQGWIAIWPLLAALAALGALAGAFALRQRGLMALCVVAALAHVSHFYYAMGTTLLVKSATMMALGAVLLGVSHALRRRGPA